jgi:hypothetical protein
MTASAAGASAGGGAVDAVFPGGGAARASGSVFGAYDGGAGAGRRVGGGRRRFRAAAANAARAVFARRFSSTRTRRAALANLFAMASRSTFFASAAATAVRSRMEAVVAAIFWFWGSPRRIVARRVGGRLAVSALPETDILGYLYARRAAPQACSLGYGSRFGSCSAASAAARPASFGLPGRAEETQPWSVHPRPQPGDARSRV